jgi:hypothetical protein
MITIAILHLMYSHISIFMLQLIASGIITTLQEYLLIISLLASLTLNMISTTFRSKFIAFWSSFYTFFYVMPSCVAHVDPILDQSSPFFVHPTDGPSSVTVTPMLTNSNYHSWVLSYMHRALYEKIKLEFINGTIAIPVVPSIPLKVKRCLRLWVQLRTKEKILI